MIKTGTDYFRDELTDWSKTLDFYRDEIPGFEYRLIELIQRNTDTERALRSESFLNEFAELHNKINLLHMEVKRLKGEQNGAAHSQPVSSQDTLRENMQLVEKDFVETKYRCHQFLASVYNAP